MSDNHLTEPLDYLYEELSPEGMAEARKHLAVCPDCRARVRDIRETVKLYRQLPRPAAPAGLAARAASAALAAAKEPPPPAPVVLATPAPARARIPSADAAEQASEQRRTKLEEDFERLKQEVKEEMRRGWRQWFFHPAWTIAASALLLASLAIHYSPRERYEQPVRPRESALVADSARVLRNRERIPAPEPLPQLAGAAGAAIADDPDQPVTSTALPPAPAALRAANARRDLPLPSLARMRSRALPAARAEIAQLDAASEEKNAPKPAETEASTEIARVEAAPPPAAAAPVILEEFAEAEMAVTAAPVVEADAAPAADPAPALDEAAATASPSAVSVPAQSGETTPILTPDELASLVAVPVDENAEDADATVIAMAEMAPPQVIERPEGFDTAERIRTLSALAGMQIASGEIADAWKTVNMLRRYSPAAAEEISTLITEAEKAAPAEEKSLSTAGPAPAETSPASIAPAEQEEPSAPSPAESASSATGIPAVSEPEPGPAPAVPVNPEPAVEPAPAAAPAPVPPFPGAMIEPPEDPPMSMVIVPAYMQPAAAREIAASQNTEPPAPVISEPVPSAPGAALREILDPSRSAELARVLSSPVIPLQVYIRPVVPAVVAPAYAPVPEPAPEPVPAPAPAPKKVKRNRSGNTPYLRDY